LETISGPQKLRLEKYCRGILEATYRTPEYARFNLHSSVCFHSNSTKILARAIEDRKGVPYSGDTSDTNPWMILVESRS
jgi:hypothetical protein